LLIKKANGSGGSKIQQQMQQEATSRCGTNENVVNLCSRQQAASAATASATAAGCLLTSQGAKRYHQGPKKATTTLASRCSRLTINRTKNRSGRRMGQKQQAAAAAAKVATTVA